MNPPIRFLTTNEAAAYLGLSAAYLREIRCYGPRENGIAPIPFVRTGRYVRYDLHELDKWIDAHRVEPATAGV